MNDGTNANQVIAFNANGEILANYTYDDAKTIGTINYYDTANGDLRFLVSCGHGPNVKFQLVRIKGGKLIDEGNKNFIAKVPYKDFDRGNDHYYDLNTKQLYVTKFKEPGSGDITTNLVLQYDLSGNFFGKTLTSDRTLKVCTSGDEVKFEIEGICVYNNLKYISANVVKLNSNNNRVQADAIF